MSRRPNFGGMGMGNMQGLIKQAKRCNNKWKLNKQI